MDRLINHNLLEGWVPLRLYWKAQQPMIDWCYLGRNTFTDPFFEQTIGGCLNHPFNLLFRHQTPIEVLRQRYEAQPGLEPSGFIFHMSRSGSTLISRMLAALPQNIVISEARPIDVILRAHFKDESVGPRRRSAWLRWMVSALAQPRLGAEKHFFIKFEAWQIFELPMIRLAFPNVPWIFVYRDPVDVLVSQMENFGQILPSVLHPSLLGNDTALLGTMAPEEYYARVLAAICRAAREHQPNGGLLINYRQLPDAVAASISEFFGITWSVGETENMRGATKVHSKEPGKAFKNDSTTKHEKATDQVREAARQWLYPVYEELESTRLARAEPAKIVTAQPVASIGAVPID